MKSETAHHAPAPSPALAGAGVNVARCESSVATYLLLLQHGLRNMNNRPAQALSVLRPALLSRLLVVTLAVISNLLLPDHAAQGVLEYTFATDCHLSPLLSAFTRWDGAHFLNVAQHGWREEWTHAFFPIYPLMM